MSVIAQAEGTAYLMISGRDSKQDFLERNRVKCMCCRDLPFDGNHVFGAGIKLDSRDDREGSGFIHDAVWQHRADIDGKRVRVTVEVIDAR